MAASILVIVNPAAGGGRGASVGNRLSALLAAGAERGTASAAPAPAGALETEVVHTTRPGEEEKLARAAAVAGVGTIVAVGGDGTWGNVAHGIVTSGASPRLALIAAGTGNDFAKSVAAPAGDPVETLRLIRSGAERRVDVGLAGDRVFLNDFGVGFDAAVLLRAAQLRMVRGATRYLFAALLELFSYRGLRIRTEPSGDDRDTLLLVLANGRWFGGLFEIAPGADPYDGRLDLISVSDVHGWRRVALLLRAMRGQHIGHPAVRAGSGSSFTLTFDAPPLVNTDGDVRRASDSEIVVRVLPRALRLVAPS